MFSVPSLPGDNRGKRLGEFERTMNTRDTVEGFYLLKNSHKLCRGFHQAMKVWKTFYFFYKIIIFRLKKEKDNIRSSYAYFNFFHKTTLLTHFRAS